MAPSDLSLGLKRHISTDTVQHNTRSAMTANPIRPSIWFLLWQERRGSQWLILRHQHCLRDAPTPENRRCLPCREDSEEQQAQHGGPPGRMPPALPCRVSQSCLGLLTSAHMAMLRGLSSLSLLLSFQSCRGDSSAWLKRRNSWDLQVNILLSFPTWQCLPHG